MGFEVVVLPIELQKIVGLPLLGATFHDCHFPIVVLGHFSELAFALKKEISL